MLASFKISHVVLVLLTRSLHLFIYFVVVYVYDHGCAMKHVWRSEDIMKGVRSPILSSVSLG